MMDRAEWTRQIEAEVAELQRDLAEARMPAPRSRKNYVECLTLLPQLTNAELEQLKLALLAQAMERGDAELCREFLSNIDACPCCGRWMGHNRPPADDEGEPTPPTKQASFEF